MDKVLVINGPNLNLLGSRNPAVYGQQSLHDLERFLTDKAKLLGIMVDCRQTNHEGKIIDWLQEANRDGFIGVILNAGAYTHYSYAIRDCIEAIGIPVIEVHISNIYSREEFRHRSVIAPVASGHISGLGFYGYRLALEAILHLKGREENGKNQ
jgi:3-dehydroquinate dehydratase II